MRSEAAARWGELLCDIAGRLKPLKQHAYGADSVGISKKMIDHDHDQISKSFQAGSEPQTLTVSPFASLASQSLIAPTDGPRRPS